MPLSPTRSFVAPKNKARVTQLDTSFLDLPGERIPLGDASSDTVVSTFRYAQYLESCEPFRLRRVLSLAAGSASSHTVVPDPQVRRLHEVDPNRSFAGRSKAGHVTLDMPQS